MIEWTVHSRCNEGGTRLKIIVYWQIQWEQSQIIEKRFRNCRQRNGRRRRLRASAGVVLSLLEGVRFLHRFPEDYSWHMSMGFAAKVTSALNP